MPPTKALLLVTDYYLPYMGDVQVSKARLEIVSQIHHSREPSWDIRESFSSLVLQKVTL